MVADSGVSCDQGVRQEIARGYAVALGLLTVVNVVSVQLTSGTVLRRLFVLLLTGTMLVDGQVASKRRHGSRTAARARLDTSSCSAVTWAAVFCLFPSFPTSLAMCRLPTFSPTARSMARTMAWLLYVFYIVFTALTFAFTASEFGQRSRAIRLNRDLVNRRLASSFKKVAWLLWAVIVLYAFQILTADDCRDWRYPALQANRSARSHSLSSTSSSSVLVLYVSTTIAKLVRFLLNEEFLPRTSINPGAAQAGSRLTYTGMLIVGIFIALGAAGLELSKLTVLTGAFGVGLGFGLQNVVNNFVSGIIVSLERPVKVGDFIEVGTLIRRSPHHRFPFQHRPYVRGRRRDRAQLGTHQQVRRELVANGLLPPRRTSWSALLMAPIRTAYSPF